MRALVVCCSFALFAAACTTTQWTAEYTSPEAPGYLSNKVLVVGLSADAGVRQSFETQMVGKLEAESVRAVRSIDFFENSFTDIEQKESDMDQIEEQLLEAGFDVILVTKVIGTQQKVSSMETIRDLSEQYNSFADDYYNNQDRFRTDPEPVSYNEYQVQTSVYCICPDKPRELLWSGVVAQIETTKPEQGIKRHNRILMDRLAELQLLLD